MKRLGAKYAIMSYKVLEGDDQMVKERIRRLGLIPKLFKPKVLQFCMKIA